MITIVTQCSLSKLKETYELIKTWNEIISLSIYIRMEDELLESEMIVRAFFKHVEATYEAILDISLLYETEFTTAIGRNISSSESSMEYEVWYPVNHLRNIALQTAQSDFVFLIDSDFIPNYNFTQYVRHHYQSYLNEMKKKSNMALVVAAFEFMNVKKMSKLTIPTTIEQLMNLFKNHFSMRFHQKSCKKCHAATNYKLFSEIAKSNIESNRTKAPKPYKINAAKGYEPYILINRQFLNRYDARFRGYGFNKIVHIEHIKFAQKRTFYVLPNVFIFHQLHGKSSDRKSFVKIEGKVKLTLHQPFFSLV